MTSTEFWPFTTCQVTSASGADVGEGGGGAGGRRIGLRPELPFRVRAGVEVFFDGAVRAERFVRGQIHRAHPALAEDALNAVAPVEQVADFEGHAGDCMRGRGFCVTRRRGKLVS